MKKLMLVLAAAALLFSCSKDPKEEVPSGQFDYMGTMEVIYFDVNYPSPETVFTVMYDQEAGKAELLLHQVKFVPMMPLTLDILVPDITAKASDGKVVLTGNEIIPLTYPARIEYDRYMVTDLTGTIDGDKLTLSLIFGDYPTTFEGTLVE